MSLDKLTKKNQEFIHIATNTLIKGGMSDEEIKAAIEEILPTLLEQQKYGRTARYLLGAPTQWANSLLSPVQAETQAASRNTNPWLMWLDASLLIFALFSLISGIMLMIGNNTSFGLTYNLIISIGFGGGLYIMYHYVYRHQTGKTGERPHYLKGILLTVLISFVWIALTAIIYLLPSALNPRLNVIAYLILAAAAFGLRYWLRKQYHIQSALSVE